MKEISKIVSLALLVNIIFLMNGCASYFKETYEVGGLFVKASFKDYGHDVSKALNPFSLVPKIGKEEPGISDHSGALFLYPFNLTLRVGAPVISIALFPISPILYGLFYVAAHSP